MSNINPNNINSAYPVAGVDNDSQGFRDNFTNIKNNFAYAQSELNDLQSKAIVKSALTGTTLNNNMGGTLLSSAQIQDFRETEYDNGIISTNVTLDHSRGHYHKVQTNGTVTLAFSNFPAAGTVGRIRLKLNVTSTSHRLILPSAVSIGTKYLQDYLQTNNSIGYTQSGTGIYWYEFVSDDAGATITIFPLSRPRVNPDYLYSNVSNGTSAVNTTNVSVISKLILDNGAAGALANVKVTFPSYPMDGQFLSISSNVSVTNLFLTAGNTINGNTTTLSGNSHLGYTFVNSAGKWFRTQL
ncbi:hypothetical protein EB001_03600 [bacterium]|nr:hypothetical protein [bacterium]